jgi:hypothetical protein
VEVGDVAVIAEFAGVRNVGAATEHECDLACATETPIARRDVVELAPEDIAVPGSRDLQIMNGQHWVRTPDAHGSILPRRGDLVDSISSRGVS